MWMNWIKATHYTMLLVTGTGNWSPLNGLAQPQYR